MTSTASAGGAAGACGVGLQDRVFAWGATALVAEQTLPDDLLPGTVVRVGAQTGFVLDDVSVLTDADAYALFQVKAGLSLGTTEGSALADAVKQAVEQYLTGMVPTAGGAPRRVEPGRDALVICTDGTAPASVRDDLRMAVARTGRQPPGTALGFELTVPQDEALDVLLKHVRRSWATGDHGAPTDEQLRAFLRLLRLIKVDAKPGQPEYASSVATLGTVVPAHKGATAWSLLVDKGHVASEDRLWLDRAELGVALLNADLVLAPPLKHRQDIEVLRVLSASNSHALEDSAVLPIPGNLHVPRRIGYELAEAVRDGGVLLVGDAGVGKTGLAASLARDLVAHQEVVLLRAADVAGTNRVALRHPLVEVLRAWTGPPATLVVDGLDAVRGSEDRAFLARVVESLAGSRWQVLATVRTFDVCHNAVLRDAFAGGPVSVEPGRVDPRLVGVRHLLVGDLTDEELEPVLPGAPALAEFLAQAAPELRALLRNPFNLRLASRLVADASGADWDRLSAVRTRLGLLDEYWERRVNTQDVTARAALLERLCRQMLMARDLRALEQEPTVTAVDSAAVEGLLMENVLSVDAGMIAGARRVLVFSHNILFDYAAARYVLIDPVGSAGLLAELDRDPSLPLVARPSFDIVVDRLWEHGTTGLFWPVCLELAASPHLLASLAFAGRLLSLLREPDDLQPLVTVLTEQPQDAQAPTAAHSLTSHLVGALRAAVLPDNDVPGAAEPVAMLALRLAESAQTTRLYTNAALCVDLLTGLQSRLALAPGAVGAPTRAIAVGALLDACRTDPVSMEKVAGAVCRQLPAAISVDPAVSDAVERLLDDEEALRQWGGTVLGYLPDVVRVLLVTKRALARRMASIVWGFHEQRDEQVTFAGGALLPFRESRVQQAQHGAYRLGELFGELCAADLVGAALIFCDVAATGIMASSTAATAPQDWPLVTSTATGWLQYGYHLEFDAHGAATMMAEAIGAELARRARDGVDTSAAVTVLVNGLRNTAAWAALLGGGEDKEALGRALLPVLASGSLLAHPDTHENAGRLLAALAQAQAPVPSAELEAAVAAAGEIAAAQGMSMRLMDELLGCLRPNAVTSAPLVSRLDELAPAGGPPPLTPRAQVTATVTPWSMVDDLREQGVQLTPDVEVVMRGLHSEYVLAANSRDDRPEAERQLPDTFLSADAALAEQPDLDGRLIALLVQAAALLAADPRVLPRTSVGDRVVQVLLDAAGSDDAGHFLQ